LQNPEKIRKVFRKNLESSSPVTATNGSSMRVRQLQNKFPEGGSGGGPKQGIFPVFVITCLILSEIPIQRTLPRSSQALTPLRGIIAVQKGRKAHIFGHDTAPDSFTGDDTGCSKNKGTVFRE
jgi:hypothetical protein